LICTYTRISIAVLCSDEILDHEYIFSDVKLTEEEEKEFR
jgi:hypothetical protein